MKITYRLRFSSLVVAGMVVTALVWAPAARGQATAPAVSGPAAVARGAAAERECLFMNGTAIPRLAMGVCRPGDPPEFRDQGELRLWATTSPLAGDEPAAIRPLFVPLYVYEERPGVGTTWYRLGDAYAAKGDGATKGPGPLGWADGSRLHLLESRYAYHFSNPQRVKPGVLLYQTKEAAYAALAALQRKPPGGDVLAGALVAERLEEQAWDPLASEAVPPFVEIIRDVPGGLVARAKQDPASDAALTDTTLTFPLPAENRLVRVGAVAGGAVDRARLAALQKEAQARAGIEIVFVIDETLSMKPSFGQVADFIQENLALGDNATNVKIAVSWYSDDVDGKPSHNASALEELVGPTLNANAVTQKKADIVKRVREHRERIVDADPTSQELVFEGLVAAINKAEFTPGENAMVFVVGDAADRRRGKDLDALYARLQALILQHNLQVAFIQVGDPNQPDQKPDPAFVAQATTLKKALPPGKQDAVVVQGVKNQSLKMTIADIQARMEAKRQKILRDIAKIETRNCYAKPGPVMERLIEADGLDLQQFDQGNMQFFMPAYGWLYHPQQPDATPQFRELVFLAKPEEDALTAALIDVGRQIKDKGRIDGDAAVQKLAEVLAKQSGHSQIEAVLTAAWKKLPAEERTFGMFLRDVLGLRVRSAILFHRGATKPGLATKQAADLLLEHTERVAGSRQHKAPRSGMAPPVWRDAWRVLP